MNAAEKVKATLQEHGWCQGKMQDYNGRVCLFFAMGKTPLSHAEWLSLYRKIHDTIGTVDIPRWNDQSKRTVEEVYALLDKVGAEL